MDSEVVAIVFPPLCTNHGFESVVCPTMVVGEDRVEHQFEVGAGVGVELSACHSYLYGTEVRVLCEITLRIGT